MSITLSRLELSDGSIFENVEIAPDHLTVLHVSGERYLEFYLTRKVIKTGVRRSVFPGSETEWTREEWPMIPAGKFQVAFDPAQTLHDQAYAAILADPRFAE